MRAYFWVLPLLATVACGGANKGAHQGNTDTTPGVGIPPSVTQPPVVTPVPSAITPPADNPNGSLNGDASGSTLPQNSNATQKSLATDVLAVGRTQADSNGLLMGWSGTAVVAKFIGAALAVDIEETEQDTYNGVSVHDYYDVYIDDQTPVVLAMRSGVSLYPISNTLAPAEHTVWLVKRTESQIGVDRFLDFKTDGAFDVPPTAPTRHIEYVGDSITAGYGDDCNNTPNVNFTPATEDADKSYAALTATSFGAEYTNLSFAGKGMWRNRDPIDDNVKTMPYLYNRTIADQTTAWDFTKWSADVVVINLGTNDYKAYDDNPAYGQVDVPAFESTYVTFIQTVRSHYPKATIFCAVGPELDGSDLTSAQTAVQAVVSTVNTAGDPNVFYLSFPEDPGTDYGCAYHPSAQTHGQMATLLEAAIHQHLGW